MNTSKFKQGQSVSLVDQYVITLITPEDVEQIIQMLNHPKFEDLVFHSPLPEDAMRGFFEPAAHEVQAAIKQGNWPTEPKGIIRNHDGQFMGMCAANMISPMYPGNYEIGFLLAPHAWRKGIATRACHFMTSLAFEALGAHKLTAEFYASNQGAIRVLEKNGFAHEGLQKGFFKEASGVRDKVVYGMSLDGYAQLKSKMPQP